MRFAVLVLGLMTSACLAAPASESAQIERAPLVAADVHQFDGERTSVSKSFQAWGQDMSERVWSIEVYIVSHETAQDLCSSSGCQMADGIIVAEDAGQGTGVWAMTQQEIVVHELTHAGCTMDTHNHPEEFWRVYRWALADVQGVE